MFVNQMDLSFATLLSLRESGASVSFSCPHYVLGARLTDRSCNHTAVDTCGLVVDDMAWLNDEVRVNVGVVIVLELQWNPKAYSLGNTPSNLWAACLVKLIWRPCPFSL